MFGFGTMPGAFGGMGGSSGGDTGHTSLIENGSFKDGLTGWLDRSTEASTISAHAVKGLHMQTDWPGLEGEAIVRQTVSVTTGKTYTLRAENLEGDPITVKVEGTTVGTINQSTAYSGNHVAGDANMSIEFVLSGDDKNAYLDDVSLIEVL